MDVAQLDAVVARYPWFTTARILRRAAVAGEDKMLDLHLQAWPVPRVLLPVDAPVEVVLGDSIDRFLAHGEHRIVPADGVGEDDIAAASGQFDASGTEQLAQIYAAQGLRDEARKIYERLGLENPEKSSYFAELISKLCI